MGDAAASHVGVGDAPLLALLGLFKLGEPVGDRLTGVAGDFTQGGRARFVVSRCQNVTAAPSSPARPVRPILCT